jgi:hypothetical protein
VHWIHIILPWLAISLSIQGDLQFSFLIGFGLFTAYLLFKSNKQQRSFSLYFVKICTMLKNVLIGIYFNEICMSCCAHYSCWSVSFLTLYGVCVFLQLLHCIAGTAPILEWNSIFLQLVCSTKTQTIFVNYKPKYG